jgi:hypothetical protein
MFSFLIYNLCVTFSCACFLGILQFIKEHVDSNFSGVLNSFPTLFLFLRVSVLLRTFRVLSLRHWLCVFPEVWIRTTACPNWCFGTGSLFVCILPSFYFFIGGRVLVGCCFFVAPRTIFVFEWKIVCAVCLVMCC